MLLVSSQEGIENFVGRNRVAGNELAWLQVDTTIMINHRRIKNKKQAIRINGIQMMEGIVPIFKWWTI